MKDKVIIGKWETVFLVANTLCIGLFVSTPMSLALDSGNAAWIEMLYVGILVLIIFKLTSIMIRPFNGRNILEITEYLGGKILKGIVGIIFCATLFLEFSVLLMDFAENTKISILPTTPVIFTELFYLVAIMIAAYIGIETISRMHLILYPLILIGLASIFLAAIPYFNLNNIFPLLGTGPKNIFVNSLNRIGIFSELLVLYILWSFSGKNFTIEKYYTRGIILSVALFTISIFIFVIVFPYPKSTSLYLPFFNMAKMIEYGKFFQRVESIFVFLWTLSGMLYLSVIFFAMLFVFQKSFNLKYYHPMILPFAIIAFTVSIFPENLMEMNYFIRQRILKYSWTTAIAIPFVICLFAFVKRKKVKGAEEK